VEAIHEADSSGDEATTGRLRQMRGGARTPAATTGPNAPSRICGGDCAPWRASHERGEDEITLQLGVRQVERKLPDPGPWDYAHGIHILE
jgi:hypothetical protein